MTYAIVYSSRTGNTGLLAETLREVLPEALYFGPPSEEALRADRLYVGFWTDRGRCDKQTADFLKTVTNQEIFLFGTAGFGDNQAYFDKILRKTAGYLPKTARLTGSFLCQGKMPLSVRQRYEKMLRSPLRPPHLQALVENFDRALSHPDARDLAQLKAAVHA